MTRGSLMPCYTMRCNDHVQGRPRGSSCYRYTMSSESRPTNMGYRRPSGRVSPTGVRPPRACTFECQYSCLCCCSVSYLQPAGTPRSVIPGLTPGTQFLFPYNDYSTDAVREAASLFVSHPSDTNAWLAIDLGVSVHLVRAGAVCVDRNWGLAKHLPKAPGYHVDDLQTLPWKLGIQGPADTPPNISGREL